MAEALWDLRGRVRDLKANCPSSVADGFINRRVRNICEKRSWTDLLRLGTIAIPNAYRTGTVTLTQGSNVITGNGTTWLVNDKVNTALTSPIVDLGYNQDITPADMTGIAVGQFVIIENETPFNREIVPVTHVGPDRFTAYVRKKHDAGVTVISSSLAGLQLNVNDYVWTVQGVLSPTSLQIDQRWSGVAAVSLAYQIALQYAQVTPVTKRLLYAWDPVQGATIGVKRVMETLNMADPQRSSTGDPQELVAMPPNAAGVMQFEVWPVQTTPRLLNVVSSERWPTLRYDTDLSPWFLNPEIFIAGACADALRTRVIPREGRTDPFYSLEDAAYWEAECSKLTEEAEQADSGRYMRDLQSYEEQCASLSRTYNWGRNHAVAGWSTEF